MKENIMSKLIVGFTGSFGSGCTATAKYLEASHGFKRISISENILLEIAKNKGLPFSAREEKQDAGNLIRKEFRDDYKNKLLELAQNKGDKIVIECFRNPIEIDWLRDEYPHFYLISLFSNKNLRKTRKKKEDGFDQADKRDVGEDDKLGQQVRKCVNQADIALNNSDDWDIREKWEEYSNKLLMYLRLLKEPFRTPSEKEIIMHLAYSYSLRSLCIQRQVGAVITDSNHRILSFGYNATPKKSHSCLKLHSQCFRSIQKRNSVAEQINESGKILSRCPFCVELSESNSIDEESFICKKCGANLLEIFSPGKELDYCRSLHAEENAILTNPFLGNGGYLKIFSTTFPCMLCAKKIVNAGIKEVIFVEPYPAEMSYNTLKKNEVEIEIFEGVKSLSFNWIFRKRGKFIKELAFKKYHETMRSKEV
jgi:dCMP deaminase